MPSWKWWKRDDTRDAKSDKEQEAERGPDSVPENNLLRVDTRLQASTPKLPDVSNSVSVFDFGGSEVSDSSSASGLRTTGYCPVSGHLQACDWSISENMSSKLVREIQGGAVKPHFRIFF
ncbi:hypothetical protein CYMTET_44247 [Cymbomonas tetramitiformis]|uniref:Uncharacterized protein n=1 Tax=Cymbomonas tetramitiformis TaxID=36881 RepID=A0AAE0C0M1_9CHLO|nr:hypothetical protein CYMTET_44247 [Cymbomonas tetramitiformis]